MLIVRLDAIGDALATVPLIAALRGRGMRVGSVLQRRNAAALSSRALDRVHIANGAADIAGEIRCERYDYALIASEKPLAYRIAAAAGIPVRIGFQNGWGKPLKAAWVRRMCTQTVFRTAGPDPHAPHECEVLFSLARQLLPDEAPPRELAILRPLIVDDMPAPDERVAIQVTDKWQRLGAALSEVAELVRRIAMRRSVRLIGSAHERAYCSSIRSLLPCDVDLFAEIEPWKQSIAAAQALVAPDCGAIHVAGMTGTPTIACFAAEGFRIQSARWAPWAASHRAVPIQGRAWTPAAADALEYLLSDNPASAYIR